MSVSTSPLILVSTARCCTSGPEAMRGTGAETEGTSRVAALWVNQGSPPPAALPSSRRPRPSNHSPEAGLSWYPKGSQKAVPVSGACSLWTM